MRLPLLVSAFALIGLPGVAFADEGAARSPASFICDLTGDCGEPVAEAATREAPETRSFRLAAPRSRVDPSAAQAPSSSSGVMLAKPRHALTAPGVAQPRVAPPKVAAARPAAPAGAGYGRTDLRLGFGPASAVLVGRELADVRNFAVALKSSRLSGKRIRIEGHTDSLGGREANVDLSRRRAQSVADTLVAEGVERDRIDVVGYGFDRPLPGVASSAGENRRVEAVLLP